MVNLSLPRSMDVKPQYICHNYLRLPGDDGDVHPAPADRSAGLRHGRGMSTFGLWHALHRPWVWIDRSTENIWLSCINSSFRKLVYDVVSWGLTDYFSLVIDFLLFSAAYDDKWNIGDFVCPNHFAPKSRHHYQLFLKKDELIQDR